MSNICRDCQDLVSHKQHESHMLLNLLSSLPNSQLYKCSLCQSYLHRFDQDWEVLIEGQGINAHQYSSPMKQVANR